MKNKVLTQEQIDYRKDLLIKRVSRIKRSKSPPPLMPITEEDKISNCLYYMDNCVYWINEYIVGNVDKKKLLEAVLAIQSNGKKLEMLLKSEPH